MKVNDRFDSVPNKNDTDQLSNTSVWRKTNCPEHDDTFPNCLDFFEAINNNSPVGIFIINSDLKYIYSNMKYLEILSLEETDITLNWQNYLLEEDKKEILKEWNKTILLKGKFKQEFQIEINEECKWIELRSNPIFNDDQSLKGYIGFLTDISDRKNAQKESDKIKELNEKMSRIGKIGGWEFDPLTLDGTWTEAVSVIHDLDPKDKTNVTKGLSYYHGENKKLIEKAVEDAIKFGKSYDLELELVSALGKKKWVRTIAEPITENGKVVRVQGTFQDISDIKEAEKSLVENARQYKALFQDSPIPLYEEDLSALKEYADNLKFKGIPDIREYLNANQSDLFRLLKKTKILTLNKAALKLNEVEDAKDLENNIPRIFNKSSLKSFRDAVVAISEGRTLFESENMITTRNGKKKYIKINWAVVPGYENTFKKVYLTTIDITQRKIFEKELIKAKENAEKADRLKSAFLAQMSHEIRTPINAILSLTSLLKYDLEETADEDQKISFELIAKSGNRIVRTIDLLLNLSEIQAGTYEPINKKFDLYSDIIGNLIVEYKTMALEKNLKINTELITNDFELFGDSYTVHQIFSQLIDNAIKYTHNGEVKIKIFRNTNGKLITEIRDTGIGISSEFLPDIFNPFTQEEVGYTRRYEGSGIGLTLVKNYCKINNAELEVDSLKNVGSTFRIIFN